ncbi:MAG: metal-sensitive transcriptional regulator [Bdellovibrionales bacterium]|nr:metal-sensitive transcriptional regulator [Bdellovibrionales bacterium]
MKHCDELHPSHKKQISRINRLSGQLEGVKRMIESQRYCPEILTQLRAIRSAVKSLEANVLQTHLTNCVTETFSSKRVSKREKDKKIEELIEIFKRFD